MNRCLPQATAMWLHTTQVVVTVKTGAPDTCAKVPLRAWGGTLEEAIGLWHKVARPVGRQRDKVVRRDCSMDSRWHPSRRGLAAILIRNRGVGSMKEVPPVSLSGGRRGGPPD